MITRLVDTSAMKRAYYPNSLRRRIRTLISRSKDRVHIAEITVVEFISALGRDYRDSRITLEQFVSANDELIVDIAEDRLKVLPFRSSDFLGCRSLINAIGIGMKLGLHTQDTMIAFTARELALARKELIELVTCDKGLRTAVRSSKAFFGLVRCNYLQP